MTGRPKRRRSASDSDEVERLRRENERLREKVDEQAKQIADAEKQIADLERQLALRQQNSTTTSKPPSSDRTAADRGAHYGILVRGGGLSGVWQDDARAGARGA